MHHGDSDQELLDLWIAGDKAAGEALFDRHFDSVSRFLRGKVHDGLEDLVQQVFLGCIEARARLQAVSSFRGYLFGIARHQLLKHYREAGKRARLDFGVTSLVDLGTTPTGTVARNDESRAILEALQTLPVDQQIALELTYWEGLKAPEVAIALDVPVDTVYTRLRRAKAQLRTALRTMNSKVSPPSDDEELPEWLGGFGPS